MMTVSNLKAGIELFWQTLFPPHCPETDEGLWGTLPGCLSREAADAVEWIGNTACARCGAPPGPHAVLGAQCTDCHALGEPRFTRALGVVRYRGPARPLVWQLKYQGARHLAPLLGRLMAGRVQQAGLDRVVDCVLPVPLHQNRLRERGYNQSGLLAKHIGRALARPFRPGLLGRSRHGPPQRLGDRAHRLTALAGAFHCPGPVPPRILLVDDVMTTGGTVQACATALRQAGARRVYVICFAR